MKAFSRDQAQRALPLRSRLNEASACLLVAFEAADPSEGRNHLDRLGGNLLAEDALEDGGVKRLDLVHAMGGQDHVDAALIAEHPAAAATIKYGACAGRLALNLLQSQGCAECDIGAIQRWRSQLRCQRPTTRIA